VPGVRGANIDRAAGNAVTFDITARGGSEAIDHALGASAHFARAESINGHLQYQYRP
jgi:hypothetical protein